MDVSSVLKIKLNLDEQDSQLVWGEGQRVDLEQKCKFTS